MNKIAFMVLIVVLSGCGTVSNRFGPQTITALENNKAIIVISAGAPEKCRGASSFLKLMNAQSSYNGREIAVIPIDSSVLKSDFNEHHGSVSVLSLEPGSYYFAPIIANPYVTPKTVRKANFQLAAGDRVYLGEYYMPISCVLNPSIEYRDMKNRDMEIVENKNPLFKEIEFETRILKDSGYIVGGDR